MAHLGKAYKVQFRRDLSREALNRNGYPEAYRFSASGFTGAVAIDFLNNLVPLINLATNAQPPMRWQSATRTAGGVNYNARLIIDDPFNLPNSTLTFVVRDLTHSVDLFSMNKAVNTYAGVPAGQSSFSGRPFTDSPLWKASGADFFWNTDALGWRDYNP